ncbi:toll/interleukin-1 receptor domain-containing protein [Falsiroseomonas sp. HC035]|uniref:toll/interleukin-1 receptor domain-containing protein n=1 Tax=Falsiroseomonas sp. HC035 TaxID=3390999 RepID=UPI003D31C82E
MSIGVFISYNHTDAPIAVALNQSLLALSPELSVFIDHSGLEAGDEYESKLARSISASQWFLIVCSGAPRLERDMGWCLYEAGQFRQKLVSEKSESLIKSRLVAIHDDKRPRQLSHFQSTFISGQDRLGRPLDLRPNIEDNIAFENTELYFLFEAIIRRSREEPLRDLSDTNVRNLLREGTKKVIRAFLDMQAEEKLPEIVLQPRISFRLPPTVGRKPVLLTADTKITSYESSLSSIFGINGADTTWGEIKLQCQGENGNDAAWVTDIEKAAGQVSLDLVPEQPVGLCVSKSDGKFYRVLLARYEPFKSKARTCYAVFIPTRPRGFDLRQRTSILLSSLILAIRFRQRILPYMEKIEAAPWNAKPDKVFALEKELTQIETEAQEFGLVLSDSKHDDPPLLGILREGESKQFVEICIASWKQGRPAVGTAFSELRSTDGEPPALEVLEKVQEYILRELQKIKHVNGRFIQILAEELLFTERVGVGEESMRKA